MAQHRGSRPNRQSSDLKFRNGASCHGRATARRGPRCLKRIVGPRGTKISEANLLSRRSLSLHDEGLAIEDEHGAAGQANRKRRRLSVMPLDRRSPRQRIAFQDAGPYRREVLSVRTCPLAAREKILYRFAHSFRPEQKKERLTERTREELDLGQFRKLRLRRGDGKFAVPVPNSPPRLWETLEGESNDIEKRDGGCSR